MIQKFHTSLSHGAQIFSDAILFENECLVWFDRDVTNGFPFRWHGPSRHVYSGCGINFVSDARNRCSPRRPGKLSSCPLFFSVRSQPGVTGPEIGDV